MRGGIRVPNKLLLLIGLVTCLGLVLLLAHGDALLYQAGRWLAHVRQDGLSNIAFTTLVRVYPASDHVPEALYSLATTLPPYPRREVAYGALDPDATLDYPLGTIYIQDQVASGPVETVEGPVEPEPDVALKIDYLQRLYTMHPDPPWGSRAAAALGLTLSDLGHYGAAVTWLERAMEGSGLEDSLEITVPFRLAHLYLYYGRVLDAEDVLRHSYGATLIPEIAFELAHLLELQGRIMEAVLLYEQLALDAQVPTEYGDQIDARAQRLRRIMAGLEPGGVVEGRVFVNGYGMPGVRVTLTSESEPWGRVVQGLTDASGTFRIWSVQPGQHRIGLFVPYEAVAGGLVHFPRSSIRVQPGRVVRADVRFERPPAISGASITSAEPYPFLEVAWEPEPEAAAYTLLIEWETRDRKGFFDLTHVDELPTQETSVRIPLDHTFTDAMALWEHGSWGLRLEPILALRTPGIRLRVRVVPLDASGNALLNSGGAWQIDGPGWFSRRIAVVDPPSYELTAADDLLIAGAYAEAVPAYLQQLEEDPHDERALNVLAYLHRYGVDEAGTMRNPQKAEEYTARLRALRNGVRAE